MKAIHWTLEILLGALLLFAGGCDSSTSVPTPEEAASTPPLTTPQNTAKGSSTAPPRVPNP
jgi:hypothetical protein